jgi:hypothetical protein
MTLSGKIARSRKAVRRVLPNPPRIPVVGIRDRSVKPESASDIAVHSSPKWVIIETIKQLFQAVSF